MSKHLTLLLNQYAERIVQLERQLAELRDELEQYEGASEALAESREESVEQEEEEACDCPACNFESFMESMGIPVQGPQSEGADQLRGLDPEKVLEMLLGARDPDAQVSSAEKKAEFLKQALANAGIKADVVVRRRGQ